MKIYTSEYEMSKPTLQTIWTPQFSDVAIGVKVLKNGESQEFTITQEGATEPLVAEDETINGFKIFKIQTFAPQTVSYKIESGSQVLKLVHCVTATKVFEVDMGGGSSGNPLLQIKLDVAEELPYVGQDYVTEDDNK